MNLIQSIDIWLNHIVTNASKNHSNIHSYNGHSINGLKSGTNTKDALSAIMNLESISSIYKVMAIDNMNEILLIILKKVEPSECSETIYLYMKDYMLTKKMSITKSLSNDDIAFFSNFVAQCEDRFNQTSSSSSSNQSQSQLSQLILALNNSPRINSNDLSLYDLQMTILGSIDGMKTQILDLKNDMESRFGVMKI